MISPDSKNYHVHGLLVVVAFRKHSDHKYDLCFATTIKEAEQAIEQSKHDRGDRYEYEIYGAEETIKFTKINNP